MKIWAKAGIIIITSFIELLLANILTSTTIKPDLMLIVVICLSFLSDVEGAIVIGFTGGLVKDIFSVNLLGANALVKTIIAYISGIIRERIFHQHIMWVVTIATFFFTFLNNFIKYYLLKSLFADYTFIEIFKNNIMIQGVLNCILTPFIFISIKKLLTSIQQWS